MNKNEWIVLGTLGTAVILVMCVLGALMLSMLADTPTKNTLALVEPTATATIRPTWTPEPTSTPAPTPTRVIQSLTLPTRPPAATRTRMPSPIQDGWDKLAQVQAARFELDLNMKGNLSVPGMTGNVQASLLNLSGEMSNKDAHLVFKGLAASYLGSDADKGFEMTSANNKFYIRGPVPMLGAPDAKWYVGTREQFASAGSLSQATTMPETMQFQNPDWTGFKKTGTETLDKLRCDVYSSDKEATLRFFQSFSTQGMPDIQSVGDIDAAETKFWVCTDGYLHQFTMNLTVHSKGRPNEVGMVQLRLHFSDLNGNIKITIPTDAVPLQIPTPSATRNPFT